MSREAPGEPAKIIDPRVVECWHRSAWLLRGTEKPIKITNEGRMNPLNAEFATNSSNTVATKDTWLLSTKKLMQGIYVDFIDRIRYLKLE